MLDVQRGGLLTPPAALAARLTGDGVAARNRHQANVSLWLDEHMWGHRLLDAQTPWLVFLEFLMVADAMHDAGHLMSDSPFPLRFHPKRRLHLRSLLFNSDEALRHAESQSSDTERWAVFLSVLNEAARGVTPDFQYLPNRFDSFGEFADVLRLLRGSVIEQHTNKKWTSRFLFPFGPAALYEGLDAKADGTFSRDYNNLGRTGELLYLMLARSNRRTELHSLIAEMLQPHDRYNRLVRRLQPEGEVETVPERGWSYLPYDSHPVFDDLAEDWLAIHGAELPGHDAYAHYSTLAGLHLVRYFLAVAAGWAGEGDGLRPPRMICEVVAPKKTFVRDRSVGSYTQNDALSVKAVDRAVAGVAHHPRWAEHLRQGTAAFDLCRELLKDEFCWNPSHAGPNEPDVLLTQLRTQAADDHGRDLGDYHRMIGRAIGLVSKRGTNRFRYAPSDDFFKTLVIANVSERVEFETFLETLHRRYGLVIGDVQARQELDEATYDQGAFRANKERLEDRLQRLGLLRRLSDACAYVVNPYRVRSDRR